MAYPYPIFIPPYSEFLDSPPSIPKFYWEVHDQEQRFHRLCEELHKLVDYANQLGKAINLDHEIIEQLEKDFQKFMESGFDDYYKEQLTKYIEDHFSELIQQILNHGVYFGITDDGYFCANVVWQLTIYFDCIADYASDDYGRIVLNY